MVLDNTKINFIFKVDDTLSLYITLDKNCSIEEFLGVAEMLKRQRKQNITINNITNTENNSSPTGKLKVHLTQEELDKIKQLLTEGKGISEIAILMNRAYSTIYSVYYKLKMEKKEDGQKKE